MKIEWAKMQWLLDENDVTAYKVAKDLGFHPLAFLHSWELFSQNLAYSTLFPTIPKITHNSPLFSSKLAKNWLIFARENPGQSRGNLGRNY